MTSEDIPGIAATVRLNEQEETGRIIEMQRLEIQRLRDQIDLHLLLYCLPGKSNLCLPVSEQVVVLRTHNSTFPAQISLLWQIPI